MSGEKREASLLEYVAMLGNVEHRASREYIKLESERDACRDALQAAVDDLRMRGEEDSDGVVVVDVGCSVWIKMNEALS